MHKMVLALVAMTAFAPAAFAQTTAWADKLFANRTTHDFGVVPRGTQLKHSFQMTNIYKEPLEITQVRVSCGCVTATPSVKVLQPNETAQLHINMDARQFSGPKSVRVYLTVGPKYVSTATLTVTANARADVVFNPGEIDFGSVARGQTPTRSIDVEYVGAFDWRVSEIVKSSAAPFELRVEELPQQVSQPARHGYRIFATIKADAPAGPFKQEILLKTNDPSNPTLTFNIHGAIQAGLAVTPAGLSVAGLKVGTAQSKKVIVRGQRPFRILGIDGLGNGITAELPDQQGTTHILTINVLPGQPGELRRQLVIRTDLDNETAVVTVEGDVVP
jgi:hypothetical protein